MAMSYRYPGAQKCVNCGWNMARQSLTLHFPVAELPAPERELLTNWLPAVDNLEQRVACKECASLLRVAAQAEGSGRSRRVSHVAVCVACGDSVLRRRTMIANPSRPEHHHIFQQFLKIPIEGDMKLCRPCIKKAKREIEQRQRESIQPFQEIQIASPEASMTIKTETPQLEVEVPAVKQMTNTKTTKQNPAPAKLQKPPPPKTINLVTELVLDGYEKMHGKRAGLCAACEETAVRRLNLATRQELLLRHKLYVSTSARVCERHRLWNNWPKLGEKPCAFTGEEIADMVFLLKAFWPINLEKLEDLDPFLLEQWIGMSLEEFQKEYEKSALKEREGGKFALAVYLAHTHTGECATVLASLCQKTRGAVETALNMAKETYPERVPQNTATTQ